MFNIVAAGFLGALVAPWVFRSLKSRAGWVISLLPLSLFLWFCQHLMPGMKGEIVTEIYPWIPSLGINLAFYLDGLSLLFALIITGIGTFIMIYTGGYMEGNPQTGRLYAFLLMFMASMLGLVLSSNLICLFMFWELTSVSSYFLIGFDSKREEARAAATKALLITGTGGLCLLVGFLLLATMGGSLQLVDLFARADQIREHSLYLPALLLILLGCFTKSAQVPFHFWLPGAMEAPSPVSAYLHSATMVKAGVYLLARLLPVMGGTEIWHNLLVGFGLTTMFIGAYEAFLKNGLKQILAYSTVSVLGFLVLQLGVGREKSLEAAMVFLVAHALSKAALFLIAGAIDHSTGTKLVTMLSGLKKYMPFIAVAAFFATLSKIGMPPFIGFYGKELGYEALLKSGVYGKFLVGVATSANIFLVAAILLVGMKPFVGRPVEFPHTPHDSPISLWIGPIVLALAGLVFGLVPDLLDKSILPSAITSIAGEPSHIHLALWHGFNPVLILSAVTLAGGFGLYFVKDAARPLLAKLSCFRFEWLYELALAGLDRISHDVTSVLQNGRLRYYLSVLLSLPVIFIGWRLFRYHSIPMPLDFSEMPFYQVAICSIIVIAGLWTMVAPTFLAGIFAMGLVGFGIATLYIFYGAPDLAVTQFIIETLTLVLFLSILSHFPKFSHVSSPATRARDLLIAISFGATMTALVLVANAIELPKVLTEFFASHSYDFAHGRNVVNVIIVDFRGFDTLGEITVLSVAGIAVYALLKMKPGKDS